MDPGMDIYLFGVFYMLAKWATHQTQHLPLA
jgi:hypothetical protein